MAAHMSRWCPCSSVCQERPSEVPGGRRQASCEIHRLTNSLHAADSRLRKVCSPIQTPLVLGFFFSAVWSGTAICDAPLHHLLPLSRGCLPPASLVVSSVSQPPRPLCPLPGTAYRTPRCPHSCSALLTGDHRLKPGRITDTRCLCV